VLHVPAGHCTHSPFWEYAPAGHVWQEPVDACQPVPGVVQVVQEVAPGFEKEPAAQLAQVMRSPNSYSFAGQGWHVS
jgi:hypothetical protein